MPKDCPIGISQEKDNRIKTLEDIIIDLGHDPKDPKAIQALLKERDADISALRKMVKIPATLHPQIGEVAQQRKDQDVTAMLITLHKRLVQTEGKLEETKAALHAALQQKKEAKHLSPLSKQSTLRNPLTVSFLPHSKQLR